ncbi:MAG: outer membrane beta-barrel protein [Pseudomarimonas sp.]
MIRKTPISRSLAALMLCALAGGASAEEGFYVGGGAGQAFVDEGLYDDEDFTLSVFGGYQFNRHFAVEGGYIDLGEIEPEAGGAALDADSLQLAAVGFVPITEAFSLYGKAGLHRWDADTGLALINGEDSGTDPTYGFGAQYRFSERFALRADVSRFEMEDVDVDVAQLQARFDF